MSQQDSNLKKIQFATVIIKAWNALVTVIYVYYLLQHVISDAKFEDFFRLLDHRLIAKSDYNVKHPKLACWMKGQTLERVLQAKNFRHLSTEKLTYWSMNRKKLLTYCASLSSSPQKVTNEIGHATDLVSTLIQEHHGK